MRRRAKAINFGIIYGISAFGLANQLGISRHEASDYIKAYFEKFPGIRDYMEHVKAEAKAQGYVSTLFGRKVHTREINAKIPARRAFAERAAINAPIQGTAADIIRRAMVQMPAALEKAGLTDAKMLLQVHDELIFEAPESDCDNLIKTVRQTMENALRAAPVLLYLWLLMRNLPIIGKRRINSITNNQKYVRYSVFCKTKKAPGVAPP